MHHDRFERERTRKLGAPGTTAPERVPRGGTARLACERCRVAYAPAAVAREPMLVAGAICRRCGGTLQPHAGEARTDRPGTVVAVRPAVGGGDGVPVA